MTVGAYTGHLNPASSRNALLYLEGDTTGNSMASVQWGTWGQQLQIRKRGTGTWSIEGNVNLDDGRIYVDEGTLVIKGTENLVSHTIRVSEPTTATTARLSSGGRFTITDTREHFLVYDGGTIAPGVDGVGTMTVRWNSTRSDVATVELQTGSTYEWEIGDDGSGGVLTDVLAVEKNNAPNVSLLVGDMTLKILDAGGAPSSSQHLAVFTYETGVTVDLSGFLGKFDTTALDSAWTIGTLSLTDDGNGTVYLTGLSKGTAGDVNGDGIVDAADYILMKQNWGNAAGLSADAAACDLDGSGTVGIGDLNLLATAINGAAGAAVTPEPATLALLAFGGLAVIRRRRK